jgi:Na+/proline symporter
MKLPPLDVLIIVTYLAAIVVLGTAMKRRAARNVGSYFLGERQLPWWALAMSGSSSYFDITGTMWIVSLFFVIGLKGMWVQWIWGFPITVFYLAYMGKWIRRSGVMTGSEWMRTRFGSGKAGELARLSYTVYAVLTITAFLAYGAEGMGKFGSIYLPFNEHVCAALILGLTGIYVIMGGFHGVVMVEVVQTVILSAGALVIACLGFSRATPELLAAKVPADWWSMMPAWRFDYLAKTEYYLFGPLLVVWLVKGLLLDLSGPEQLYDFQRFLAAKDARDASKLGALWGVIHTIRWPMAMGLAALALVGLGSKVTDPEKALPMVLNDLLPPGLRGFAIAALLSGFLATFCSTVNGGASYIVNDLYHKYLRPDASQRSLIRASYAASAGLILLGIVIGFQAQSINQMFMWIMGTLGAGVLLPNVLRWYWWRINGWGYAIGAFSGMLLSLVQVLVPAFSKQPLYVTFPAIAGAVLLITLAVTLLTSPTDDAVLIDFYRSVQPAGWWGRVARLVQERDPSFRRESPFAPDFLNVVIGLPWIVSMYHFPIYLVLHQYAKAGAYAGVVVVLSVALYFTWYRRLPAADTDPRTLNS